MNQSDLIAERDALKAHIAFYNVNTDKREQQERRIWEIEDQLRKALHAPFGVDRGWPLE